MSIPFRILAVFSRGTVTPLKFELVFELEPHMSLAGTQAA